jgi:endonuclease/exonuclease/phosphatase (EEP) superfamily protein YafD
MKQTHPPVPDTHPERSSLFDLRINAWGLVSACGAIAVLATVLGFLGRLWWICDLFCHFRVQLSAVLLTAASLHLIRRDFRRSVIFVLFAMPNLGTIVPLYLGDAPTAPAGAVSYRAMLANVNTRLGNPRKVVAAIEQFEPDIVVLEEVDDSWMALLSEGLKAYTHKTAMPRDDNFGLAVYSKYPMRGEVRYFSNSEVPSVVAEIDTPQGTFTLIGTHAVPPASAENTRLRDDHLSQIPETVRAAKSPVLLLGDLNATPWCSSFQQLVRESGLRDSSRGRGVQPTWPSFMPLLWIPIDHCLYGPGIQVTNKRVGPNIGSDHYPVVIDFVLQSRLPDR